MNGVLAALGGAGILGSAMPAVVAVIVRAPWPSRVKAGIVVVLSVLVGTATAWAAGELGGLAWPAAIVVALGASEAAYQKWWKPTGVAPWLEQITSPQPEEPPANDG